MKKPNCVPVPVFVVLEGKEASENEVARRKQKKKKLREDKKERKKEKKKKKNLS